jgi:N6-L-threonylcarbamoyladenine synthase
MAEQVRRHILGIESSCDETAAAVVTSEGKVLSSVISSQVPLHARYGGVIPEIASRNHLLAVGPVVDQALAAAGVTIADIGRIAVTRGPGLAGALMVGLQHAKTLAWVHGVELVPVHHVEGHITAILLEEGGEHPHGPLQLPYVALAVSGGHTSLYLVREPGSYALLGVTLDDAAGEAFDKVARLLGLPYPGGVHIDRQAREGNAEAIAFPRPMLAGSARPDFSFSGLKTAVRVHVEQAAAAGRPTPLPDLAASFQEAVVDVLVRKTLDAASLHGAGDVVISGGVAANRRLREKIVAEAGKAGVRAHLTRMAYCTDNAAMIAGAGRFGQPVSRNALMRLEPFASGQLALPVEMSRAPEEQ